MASAWGDSWGRAWGDSWGAVTATAPGVRHKFIRGVDENVQRHIAKMYPEVPKEVPVVIPRPPKPKQKPQEQPAQQQIIAPEFIASDKTRDEEIARLLRKHMEEQETVVLMLIAGCLQ